MTTMMTTTMTTIMMLIIVLMCVYERGCLMHITLFSLCVISRWWS